MTQKSRKIRAIAAGGAVLGLGAAITLAAWSDSELASGFFQAGSFDIEGSADGVTWASHDTEALALSFGGTEAAGNLAPNASVYQEYHLRNAGSVPAYISYGDAMAGTLTLGTDITYGMAAVPAGGTCDEATFTAGTAVLAGEEFTLPVGGEQSYCFEVTLADGYNSTAAENGTITWTFTANQDPALPA